jgi:hypothetical protein
MRFLTSPFFICRSAGVFDLASPLPAVLSAESQTIFESTTTHARVPKTLMGVL